MLLVLSMASAIVLRPSGWSQMQAQAQTLPTAPSVARVATEQEYDWLLEGTRDGQVSVLWFSGKRCRACKALEPRYNRLAEDWPHVSFHQMVVEENAEELMPLMKGLGVKSIPYVHIVANGETVERFPCGPSKVALLEEKLDKHGAQVLRFRWWERRWQRHRWRRAKLFRKPMAQLTGTR